MSLLFALIVVAGVSVLAWQDRQQLADTWTQIARDLEL